MPGQDGNIAYAVMAAIRDGGIEVHYQPQMSADGERMTGVEALVRWRGLDGKMISPADFIPAIETDAETICALGLHIMRQACEDAKAWPDIMVAINVAPIQFTSPGFVESVKQTVLAAGLPPQRLELEILETSWFEDPQKAVQIIAELRNLGISIAMDDFGTGYASLGALMQLPLDKLKIDSSFVERSHELRSASIVHSIIALARSIGLRVTAEGVETREQQRFLRAAGCHNLQGHFFSEAVPAAEISAMLAGEGKKIRRD
jgi:EAL domain-containing protein (putative c-di-GMP-specific phosphodiesterase class I)